ncbi:MAG TPA: hypothetical protein VM713_09740, partial [Steroidobacteraceae bacterium]|nr:hypothetical protein [Steroidobacteraceae bacterium]
MTIQGIDRVTYGVADMAAARRFLSDWGLALVDEGAPMLRFETLDGGEVVVRAKDDPALPPAIEPGSTLREVVWGVADATSLTDLGASLRLLPTFDER